MFRCWRFLIQIFARLSLMPALCFLQTAGGCAGAAERSEEPSRAPVAARQPRTKPVGALQQVQQVIQRGDLTEARIQLTQALKDFPREAGFYNLLGVVDAQEGKYWAAESNFKRAIEEDPRFTGAYLNLGRLYQEDSNKHSSTLRKGLETYQRLLKIDPRNVEAIYQSAVLLERQGSFKASLDRLAQLPAPGQERAQPLAVRCADFAGLGDRSRTDSTATKLLSRAELAEADILSILPTLAEYRRDDLEVRLLEGLIDRQLASLETLHQLGLIYERRGQLDRARGTLEKVAEKQPNSVPLLLELAQVANKQRDYKGALGYLAHARNLDPRNAGVHFFFGMVCVEENLVQEAYNALKRAASLDPQNPYYDYALGAVAIQRDDPREAIPYFQKYCALKPQDPRGRFALGAAYFYSRDYAAAQKVLEAMAKIPETSAGAHYFLGRIANQEGKPTEAARQLQKALEINPGFADAHAELGHVRMNQKEYAQAEKALLRALEMDPNNYSANLNLMILYQRTKDPRANAQARRFEDAQEKRSGRAREFLRTIEVRP